MLPMLWDSFILDSNVSNNLDFFRMLDSSYIKEGCEMLVDWGLPEDLLGIKLNASNFSGGEKRYFSSTIIEPQKKKADELTPD